MTVITESHKIKDVYIVTLQAFEDERGRFVETFRKEWFPQRSWDTIQTNRSSSQAGVLRGLHYHAKQIDYWYVPAGQLRMGLSDLRASSPTYMNSQMIDLGDENEIGVFVPIGVAHGFVALTDVTLTYLVDNYYDGADEMGVAWDDPALKLDWGIESPTLSDRDMQNPLLKDIPQANLPK